jgi:hypothetical protein
MNSNAHMELLHGRFIDIVVDLADIDPVHQ